jgi:hypothetical protein
MRSKLFTLVLVPAIMAVAALTTIPAKAETKTLNVPFSFTVNGKTCPAGAYKVQGDTVSNLVELASIHSSQSFILLAHKAGKNDSRVILRFDDAGDTHALQSIQFGPIVTARLDGKSSKAEGRDTQISGGR